MKKKEKTNYEYINDYKMFVKGVAWTGHIAWMIGIEL